MSLYSPCPTHSQLATREQPSFFLHFSLFHIFKIWRGIACSPSTSPYYTCSHDQKMLARAATIFSFTIYLCCPSHSWSKVVYFLKKNTEIVVVTCSIEFVCGTDFLAAFGSQEILRISILHKIPWKFHYQVIFFNTGNKSSGFSKIMCTNVICQLLHQWTVAWIMKLTQRNKITWPWITLAILDFCICAPSMIRKDFHRHHFQSSTHIGDLLMCFILL